VGDDSDGDPLSISNHGEVARAGTLFAVYEFLERYLGIAWFYPGPVGERIPKCSRLVVPEVEVVQEPSFLRRVFLPYGGYRRNDTEISLEMFWKWCRRNKMGMGVSGFNHHNWHTIIPKKRDFAAHPEYFAVNRDGRAGRTAKLCTSIPEVRWHFVARAGAYFETHDLDLYSLSPTDGGNFCECPKCRSLDVPNYLDDRGRTVLTDRVLTFYEDVTDGFVARHPDKFPGGYIYSAYRDFPKRRKYRLPDSFVATYVFNNSYKAPMTRWESEFDRMRAWHQELPNVRGWVFYSFPTGSDGKEQLLAPPFSRADVVGELMAVLRDNGYMGVKICNFCHWQIPIDYYVMARLLWDVDQNVADVQNEYLRGMYGDASESVRLYFRWAGVYWRQLNEGMTPDPKADGRDEADPKARFRKFWHTVQGCDDMLCRAEKQASGQARERVAKLREHFDKAPKIYQGLMTAYQPDRRHRLPEMWRFKIDPKAVGEDEGWHAPGFDDSGWDHVSVHQSWEYQSYGAKHPLAKSSEDGYDGVGWYRCAFVPDAKQKDKRVVLQLGSVGDDCWVYVNGKEAGHGQMTLAERFDVTARVKWGKQNTLVVRVLDNGRWGGMCRPAFLIFEAPE